MLKTEIFLLLLISSALVYEPGPVSGAKIISIEFFGSKSHVITYLPILEELARQGHEVTLVSPSKGLTKQPGIKEIESVDFQFLMDGTVSNPYNLKENNVEVNVFAMLADNLPKKCTELYARADIKALLNQKFDLILVQPLFNDCSFGLVHKLNAPVVLFSPMSASASMVGWLGGFHPPSFISHLFLGYPSEMTFGQRMFNFGFTAFTDAVLAFYYEPIMEATYREALGQDLPSARQILANASLMLSNGHFSLSGPKPNLPDVIDVGGIHSRPAKPLPKDLEEFVSKGGKDGFILFSMGSNLKGNMMPEKKRQMFLNVFSKLKQQVVWKWESDTMPGLPPNVKLSKWLPQQDLLGHRGCKLFITHCGMGGTEEAIYHGVPLLGLPMFGDQPVNAREASNKGFMVALEWNDLTEEMLSNSIQQLLSNPKYRESVQKLSTIFRDQSNDPLKRGLYWIEYVMRHKGATHLKSASRNLNTIQYHSLDVIAAYSAIIFGALYLIFAILRSLFRCLCGSSKSSNKNISNGKKKNN